jgi:hypothetical protein
LCSLKGIFGSLLYLTQQYIIFIEIINSKTKTHEKGNGIISISIAPKPSQRAETLCIETPIAEACRKETWSFSKNGFWIMQTVSTPLRLLFRKT